MEKTGMIYPCLATDLSVTLKDIHGRDRLFRYRDYLVDWDAKEASHIQTAVKVWLRPYWRRDIVLSEAVLTGCRLRLDLLNLSRSIAIEVSPAATHSTYNPFFHGSLAGYKAVIKRDIQKAQWCEVNGLTLVEIRGEDIPLTAAWFKDRYGIVL